VSKSSAERKTCPSKVR